LTSHKKPRIAKPLRIVSGGQTGVDRAALDVAIELGIPHGGWCPRGRLAEDGPIPRRYQLQETESAEYPVRTERNVLDSDATLVLCHGAPAGGTRLTVSLARRHKRPCLVIDLDDPPEAVKVRTWLVRHHVGVLNVAGPRESQDPGVGHRAAEFLREVLEFTL
jgi:hypothetical protein